MSLPTTDTIFATARAADSWFEYPLMNRGDSTAKIYHMRCTQQLDSYRTSVITLTLGDLMANAAAAGVVSLPFLSDLSARFCGDINHNYSDGLLITFDRIFATIPATRTEELVGSRSFLFPGVRSVLKTTPASAADAATDENLWRWRNQGSGNTSPAPLYVTSEYLLSFQLPTPPALAWSKVFKVTQAGNYVDFVSNGGSGTFSNATALNGETFSGSYSVPATVPSATDYATSVANGEKKIVDVQVERYLGDIFCVKTYKMIAQ